MPKETRRKRKLPKGWRTNPAKHETAPRVLFIFSNRIEKIMNEITARLGYTNWAGGGRGGLKNLFIP